MRNKSNINFFKFFYINILIFFVFLLCLCVLIELYLRISKNDENHYITDKQLGWRLAPNKQIEIVGLDYTGRKYEIVHKTNAIGLREFGENESDLTFLVLGDSFTADPTAGNSDMWFSVFAQRLSLATGHKINVLAGGGGGYGTYQNLLLLESLKSKVKIDAFVLQFCENDYQNNTLEWERKTIVWNQIFNRPYASFESDDILFSKLEGIFPFLYRKITNNLEIGKALDNLFQKIRRKLYGDWWAPINNDELTNFHLKSIEVTEKLLKKIRFTVADTPSFLVNCSESPKQNILHRKWIQLAKNAGFITLTEPSIFVDKVQRSKKDKNSSLHIYLNGDGGHLSDLGNHKFGMLAADEFLKNDLVFWD
jgi:lysophospholipase L1-like esterase